jgi:hypothetical protein
MAAMNGFNRGAAINVSKNLRLHTI